MKVKEKRKSKNKTQDNIKKQSSLSVLESSSSSKRNSNSDINNPGGDSFSPIILASKSLSTGSIESSTTSGDITPPFNNNIDHSDLQATLTSPQTSLNISNSSISIIAMSATTTATNYPNGNSSMNNSNNTTTNNTSAAQQQQLIKKQQEQQEMEITKTFLSEIQKLERLLQDLIIQRNTNTRKPIISTDEREFVREIENDSNDAELKREEDLLKTIIESKKADFRLFVAASDKNNKNGTIIKKSAFLKSGAALVIFPTVVEEKFCSSLPLIDIETCSNSNSNNCSNRLSVNSNGSNSSINSSNSNKPVNSNNNSSNLDESSDTNHDTTDNNNNNNNDNDNNDKDDIISTICGPLPDLPEDTHVYKDLICAKSGSSYPKHFTGRRIGDPICDRFKVLIFKDKLIVSLADGCNWGRLPYEAATKATDSFLLFLEENVHEINTIRKAGSFLLAAMTAAHKGIIAGKAEVYESGTTTLIGGLLTRIKSESNIKRMSSLTYMGKDHVDATWVFTGVTLGDCKAFHYSKKHRTFSDITKGNRQNLTDARDPGGRLGPYIRLGEPDLRNLEVFYKFCDQGDLILLLSDGVHDNLDPQQLGVNPTELGIEADTWEKAGQLFPSETEDAKSDYRKRWLSDHFQTEEQLEPTFISNTLLKHCTVTTQSSRDFMEQNTSKKLPSDYTLYPGKMDHNTCVCFKVGSFN
ncbi:hypothetical protein CYY_004196 [Polysphondylium violaceum]|uniref:PPM-type phosphatase domain-containing protein n=1 Tax=Polysphondylium violaceum TaxID=133409 RepID=A0A8J4UT67_9MYCE|nr:hypothetical protein CYY_004196 [Polysphondylium violaceum]